MKSLSSGWLKFVVCEWLISYLFQVLNLFLALLLSSFGASNLSGANSDEDGTNKLTEAFNRIGRFKRRVKKLIVKGLTIIKDKILECFRKGLSLERGKTIKQKILSLIVLHCLKVFHSQIYWTFKVWVIARKWDILFLFEIKRVTCHWRDCKANQL